VSFEYLNRQLVWHAFTEFLLFLLPLVGISRWRRWLSRSWRKIKSLSLKNGSTGQEEPSSKGELGFLPERTCAICYQDQNPSPSNESEIIAATARTGGLSASAQTDITNPYQTIPCGCIYCYVCIATRLEAEDGTAWTCLRCGEMVTRCRPWAGDVVEDTSIPPGRKQAGFENEEQIPEETFTRL
jgi:peroxin-2